MDDEPNVIAFRPREQKGADRDGIICERVKKPRYQCDHRNKMIICEKRRIIECGDCGECFEPFDWLWKWVYDKQGYKLDSLHRITGDIERKQEQIAKLEEDLQSLKNSITNARAQLKRTLKKQETA